MLNIYEFTNTAENLSRRQQARELRDRFDLNAETFVENFLQDYEEFQCMHTASESAYLVNTESVRDIGEGLNPDDIGFVAPSKSQLQQVDVYARKAFPNHSHYSDALYELASRDLDRSTVSNLISNLKRMGDEPTNGQRQQMRKYWEHPRFSDIFQSIIRSYDNLKASRNAMSHCLDALKRREEELQRLFLTDAELKEVTVLYFRATGRRAEEDFSRAELREFFNAENFESLRRDLNDFIVINEREKQKRATIEKNRDGWFNPQEKSGAKYLDAEALTEEQIAIMTRKWDTEEDARRQAGKPPLTFSAWRDKERIRNSSRPRSEKIFLLQRIETNAIIRQRQSRKRK